MEKKDILPAIQKLINSDKVVDVKIDSSSLDVSIKAELDGEKYEVRIEKPSTSHATSITLTVDGIKLICGCWDYDSNLKVYRDAKLAHNALVMRKKKENEDKLAIFVAKINAETHRT